MIKIKKYILFSMIFFFITLSFVYANEYPEITNDIEVRYKWYKEIISNEGEYYPLRKITQEDRYDIDNYKYVGKANVYNEYHCTLPREYYLIHEQVVKTYRKTYDAGYVLIENIEDGTNIKIYNQNIPVSYTIISKSDNSIKINLGRTYMCDDLLFFIDTNNSYTISLYHDLLFENQIISKTLEQQKISTPDASWITNQTKFTTYITPVDYKESPFVKVAKQITNCAYQEKYVFKYNVTKEYYDDNYHIDIEGYIKDKNDYKIYYKGAPIIEKVEILQEKIIKVPQIEYKYLYIENSNQENDSSKQNTCLNETEKEIKPQKIIKHKKIYVIPKTSYILIMFLVLNLVILITILLKCRKNVD